MSRESEQAFTPEDFQKRFDTAAEAAQREYCDIFAFWRACRLKACRRSKACGGDPQLVSSAAMRRCRTNSPIALWRVSSGRPPQTPTGRPNWLAR